MIRSVTAVIRSSSGMECVLPAGLGDQYTVSANGSSAFPRSRSDDAALMRLHARQEHFLVTVEQRHAFLEDMHLAGIGGHAHVLPAQVRMDAVELGVHRVRFALGARRVEIELRDSPSASPMSTVPWEAKFSLSVASMSSGRRPTCTDIPMSSSRD